MLIQTYADQEHQYSLQAYHWDEKTKALILSSFFWGYVVTQVPAGQIAQRWGAKFLLFWSMLLCSILTLLTPLCASVGGWKVRFINSTPQPQFNSYFNCIFIY